MAKRKPKRKVRKWVIVVMAILALALIGIETTLILGFNWKVEWTGTLMPSVQLKRPTVKVIDLTSNSRPIAVMINNHEYAQGHHAGLQDAYLVYEIVVEGGITRMMAVFKDKDTAKIGSVRSSRHYFLDYAMENDAIYTHFGWSERAMNDIYSLGIPNVNGLYDSGFWRDTSLDVPYEHTAYTNIASIKEVAEYRGYRMTSEQKPLLNYQIYPIKMAELEGASLANHVSIEYSSYQTTSYEYDPTKKVYLRYTNGMEHHDSEKGGQITAKNIITYQVYNYSFDSYGRQDLDNVGSGSGYYISNGYSIPIKWEKNARGEQTKYYYENGEELKVNDGNTFIQIQPVGRELSITE